MDRAYVELLFRYFGESGVPAWFDYQMVAGDKFDTVIQTQIDACRGVIWVLTRASVNSEWVKREISYAIAGDKIVLPILLEKVRPPLIVANLQHEDVTGGQLPKNAFVTRLKSLVA